MTTESGKKYSMLTLEDHHRVRALNETQKPASIKDIARAANVSHSTVSRALRNSPLVSRETTERI
jgi:IS30 family transposase